MKKYMKSSVIKKIVVKCRFSETDFWMDEFEVNSKIFDDVYMEAATRAIERRKNLQGFRVTILLECWEKKNFKKPEKHFCYNTYYVLINAGCHNKAEMLRVNFIKMYGIDLQKESLKGENGNITTTVTAAAKLRQSNSGSIGK